MAGPPAPKRVYPPVLLLTAILLMVGLHLVAPIASVFHAPLRYFGLIPMVFGLWLVLWVRAMFIRAETTIKPFEESSRLVDSGPFRFSRNPIYLGMVLFLVGHAIMLGSLAPFLVIPIFAILLDRRFVRVEEAMLAQRFGPQFDDYTRRVRRWV
jgi:protein-S-isoprenylcysteine O-methyltransferase Ste14